MRIVSKQADRKHKEEACTVAESAAPLGSHGLPALSVYGVLWEPLIGVAEGKRGR